MSTTGETDRLRATGAPPGPGFGYSLLVRLTKPRRKSARKQDGCEPWDRVEGALRAPAVSPKAVNASEEFLGKRDDNARRASHVAEPVLVLVLGHLADELGAVGAQASDSVVDALNCKHDAP
jgi:hypothetical protein